MFVRDRQPTRAYMQLMERYRMAPELNRSLPHRAASRLEEVASGLAVVTWAELMILLAGVNPTGLEADVQREIERRFTLA